MKSYFFIVSFVGVCLVINYGKGKNLDSGSGCK